MKLQEAQIRIFTFGQFTVERRTPGDEWEEVSVKEWNGYRSPQSFLGYLLCSPKRLATRASLLRDLGPFKSDPDKAVSNAASLIRKVCGPSLLQTLGGRHNSSYQLMGQSIAWADCDACHDSIEKANVPGKLPWEKQALLEHVLSLLQRGPFLEDEEGLWCYGERGMWEKRYYQCRLQLAGMYEQQQQFDRAEMLYSTLLAENMQDEIALCRLIVLLSQQGLLHLARKRYEEVKAYLQRDQLTLSPAVEALFRNIQNIPSHYLSQEIVVPDQVKGSPRRTRPMLEQTMQRALSSTLSQLTPDIIPLTPDAGVQSMDYSRRQMLYGMLATACTTLTLSPYTFLQVEKREHLLTSLQKPSYIDAVVLADLSEITRRYWKLSANISLQLLQGILGHFHTITQLLNAIQPTSLSRELFSLSSEAAQLLGKTLFDLRDYSLAYSYYTFALKAALEVQNYDLWAAALGRMSLLLLATNNPQQALSLLQEIQALPLQSTRVQAWCLAIEAEAHSYTGNLSSCTNALKRAKDMADNPLSEVDPYATGFTRSRLASYEGSCYLRLNQPESALPILEQAVALIDPTAVRRLSRLQVYLGETHVLLGNVQQACEYASQALDLTNQTHSQDILYRVHRLSRDLAKKGLTPEIKTLHGKLQGTRMTLTNARDLYE